MLMACGSGAPIDAPETDPSTSEIATADTSTGSGDATSSSSSGEPDTTTGEADSSTTGEPVPQPGCDNGLVPGDFCFTQVSNYGPFERASWLASADYDQDGVVDLAVAATDENAVYVLFGDGLGAFVESRPLSTGARPQVLVTADFNLDERWDLATSNVGAANLSVIYGLNGAAFDPAVSYAVGDGPGPMTVGDLDGNGFDDIVVARTGGPFALRVLVGTHDGLQVEIGPQVDPDAEVLALALADIDGDANLDVLATLAGRDEVVVLAGDGTGELAELVRFSSEGQAPHAVAAADLDGDGDNDVLVGNRGGEPSLRVFDNAGDGTLQERGNYPEPGLGALATGDLDGDGDIDVVLTTLDAQAVVTLRNDGGGSFDEQDVFDLGAGSEPLGILVADLNADGVDDFATADRSGWRVVVWLSNP